MSKDLFAALEAGGTKMICAVANADGDVLAQARIATTTPDQVFDAIAAFYRAQREEHGPIRAGGIASFGPLDLDPASASHGHLTRTPKPGWSSVDMLGRFTDIVGAPSRIDTDVNCAAMAEATRGAGQGLDRLCYMTVGTGIGVGLFERAALHPPVAHAEVGHIRVSRAPGDDFAGICPSHQDCVEGLACGPAMKARWSRSAEDLPADHPAWDYAAHYIAAICVNLTYIARPQRIILGGGVLEHGALYPAVRRQFGAMTAGYALDRHSADVETFICPPVLQDPGLVGAIELARATVAGDLQGA
ncbi:ROK family protein [Sphingomonas sp. MMS12-HWE2-04]|uniref:ROK family protein n=1 Tax=Sphingomonas sp. MMS12-HWE2-04 TaxID=3234199 RepID=UPI003851089E